MSVPQDYVLLFADCCTVRSTLLCMKQKEDILGINKYVCSEFLRPYNENNSSYVQPDFILVF